MTLEAAQDVERPRHHLDHITLACEIAGEHSLLAKPFRASSHMLWLHSALRNKIPLAEQSTSGNLQPQQKAVHVSVAREVSCFWCPGTKGARWARHPFTRVYDGCGFRICWIGRRRRN